MKYYCGGNQEGIGSTLANIIRQYLSFRLENAHLSISESPYAYLSNNEKEAMVRYYQVSQTQQQISSLPATIQPTGLTSALPPPPALRKSQAPKR
jgi:hypothetical protein